MAVIKHLASGESHTLLSSHLVGRGPTCPLSLTNRLVSGEHAVFRWTGSHWELRDLGSRNGTFDGETRLDSGATMQITVGSQVAFGDPGDLFEIVDDGPPSAMAFGDNGEVRAAEGGLLSLPDEDHPELTVFEDGPGRWFVEEQDGTRRPTHDLEQVEAGGQLWRLELPVVLESTLQADAGPVLLSNVSLHFTVSRDQESINISMHHGGQKTPLQTRAHASLLLSLAKARFEDSRNSELPHGEQGWVHVEDLVTMLRTNVNQLNVSIFRARRQFALIKVLGATGIIERRPGSRQIRLGIPHVEIETL